MASQQRKRKRSKGDKGDASTAELISKLIKVQEESDKRLLQLEDKRLELRRLLEKEAQQRKEEREFQLRMMQLVMGQGYGQPQSHYHPPGPFRRMEEEWKKLWLIMILCIHFHHHRKILTIINTICQVVE